MELLQRLKRITLGNIEELLATFEDPEIVIPQLVREMENQVRLARDVEIQALADKKVAERECAELRLRLSRLGAGAETALTKGEEHTAREVLGLQLEVEQKLTRKQETLRRAEEAVEQARATRQQRQAQLLELRSRKGELVGRARRARQQTKGMRAVDGEGSASTGILDALEQAEAKIREGEAETDSRHEIAAREEEASLEARLQGLEDQAEVDKRLAVLKARLTGA